ncbi:uncharacterized protein LOC123701765 [Colias croceus]|uniref:uncharacterized protein LOC123701765 n=1 Tax=Colias crocea TaxID=72248 RepID=UPI001E27B165|nr:uncharacterized protein LOC123701765 [Colias croceus]
MYSLFVFIILYARIDAISKDKDDYESGSDLGASLVSSLRNDANLDLSVDEEYEDLRAELLAYHSALSSLASSRRSLLTTPCWSIGGICINYKLCPFDRRLTEVPGCKNRLKVCCFVWNRYEVRDMTDQGISNLAFPWRPQIDFGGEGIVLKTKKPKKKKRIKTSTVKPTEIILKRDVLF